VAGFVVMFSFLPLICFNSFLRWEAASAAERVNQNDGFPSGASVIQVDPFATPPLRLMRAHSHKNAMKHS
jgi:hypothetical protein